MKKIASFLFLSLILLACSKSGEDMPNIDEPKHFVKSQLTGKIEKGPFLTGSKITLYELNGKLEQTGKNIFKTETTNDNGEFLFDSKMELSSQFVELEISGYFFNEVTGKRSSSQITLNALADVSGKNKVNVNILTHLVYKRIKKLGSDGLTFSVAQKQAHKELLNVFLISKDIKNSEDIGLTDGNEDAAILLAISAILLQDKEEAEFSEFIAKLSNDFADDGVVSDNNLIEQIHSGQRNVNSIQVMDNLKSYFSERGKTIEIDNIRKFIDGNGDGVLDDADATIEKNLNEEISEDVFSQNEDTYRQALAASYPKIRSYFEYMLVLDAARCNLIDYSTEISSSNAIINEAWAQAYQQAIRMLNRIIEHSVDVSSFDPKPYLSTSKVLRALIYLDMIQHWGDVLFITEQLSIDEMFVPRTNKDEILNALLADLNESIPYLKEEEADHDQPIVSQDLANALIGAIYLEQKNYNEAGSFFSKIIDQNQSLSLGNTVYTDVNNNEAIFTLCYSENDQPFQIFSQYLKKGTLHPIYRNTGIYLNYAESLLSTNRNSELLSLLNQLRVAGNMNPLQELPSNPKYEIADLWKKFIGPDYGYFALLKRLGIAEELLEIQSYQQLYPIPIQKLDLDPNMTQNPGY